MSEYTVLLYDAYGVPLTELGQFSYLELVRSEMGVGSLTLHLPPDYDAYLFSEGDLIVDRRIEVYRQPFGGAAYLEGETQFLLRDGTQVSEATQRTELSCPDANDLLARRIVAYAAASAQASKTIDPADDMLKAIVRENLGALATDTDRDWSAYLMVAPDFSLGPNLSKAFSRRNVLTVLQEIAQASAEAGTYLTFDVVRVDAAMLDFRTYTGQRGIDHRWPGGVSPVLLSEGRGSLRDVRSARKHRDEITYVYAGGQGEEAARTIGTASDTARIGQSPFGRIEQFVDARMTSDAASLADEADAALRAGQPRKSFSAQFAETPGVVYGLHIRWGDYVTAERAGESIDCRLSTIQITVSEGRENIGLSLRAES